MGYVRGYPLFWEITMSQIGTSIEGPSLLLTWLFLGKTRALELLFLGRLLRETISQGPWLYSSVWNHVMRHGFGFFCAKPDFCMMLTFATSPLFWLFQPFLGLIPSYLPPSPLPSPPMNLLVQLQRISKVAKPLSGRGFRGLGV